jgi:hypothetical protein
MTFRVGQHVQAELEGAMVTGEIRAVYTRVISALDQVVAIGGQEYLYSGERLRCWNLSPNEPGKGCARPVEDPRPEEEIQADAIRDLEESGFRVLQTSVRYSLFPCPKCKAMIRPQNNTGPDGGVPDLLVQPLECADDFANLWRGIEVKGHTTPIRPAQKALLAVGAITIVRSPMAALTEARRPWPESPRDVVPSVKVNMQTALFADDVGPAVTPEQQAADQETRMRLQRIYQQALLRDAPVSCLREDVPHREANADRLAAKDINRLIAAAREDGFRVVLEPLEHSGSPRQGRPAELVQEPRK